MRMIRGDVYISLDVEVNGVWSMCQSEKWTVDTRNLQTSHLTWNSAEEVPLCVLKRSPACRHRFVHQL
jgi:hypothetical protein